MVKAQSGMDFLMTYGWALLIVVIVIGALFGLGIFDEGTFVGNKASGFTNIGVKDWQLTSNGQLQLLLQNNVGSDVNITAINVTIGNNNPTGTLQNAPVTIANGKTQTVTVTGVGTFQAGKSYSAQIQIRYVNLKSNFNATDTGTITGKVQ
ncbi:MAG: hypothetical protein N3E37_00415 [Candidatus Micrarchaeota archaeon]|nr:hypothetical protein [Candidatus Micrarchaeota archaeon]